MFKMKRRATKNNKKLHGRKNNDTLVKLRLGTIQELEHISMEGGEKPSVDGNRKDLSESGFLKKIVDGENVISELEGKINSLVEAYKETKKKLENTERTIKKIIFQSKDKTKSDILSELTALVTPSVYRNKRLKSESAINGEQLFAQIDLNSEDQKSETSDLDVSSAKSKVCLKSLHSDRMAVNLEHMLSNVISLQTPIRSPSEERNLEESPTRKGARRKTLIRVLGNQILLPNEDEAPSYTRNKQQQSSQGPLRSVLKGSSHGYASFQNFPSRNSLIFQTKLSPTKDPEMTEDVISFQIPKLPPMTNTPKLFARKKSQRADSPRLLNQNVSTSKNEILRQSEYYRLTHSNNFTDKKNSLQPRPVFDTDETQRSQVFISLDDNSKNETSTDKKIEEPSFIKKLSQKIFEKFSPTRSPGGAKKDSSKVNFFFRKKGGHDAPENL